METLRTGLQDEHKRLVASLSARTAAGRLDRRGFLRLAAAGAGSAFAVALADQAVAAPVAQGRGGHRLAGPAAGRKAMRVTVSDVVSPSYFPLTAAVELGFFKAEGIDAEFIFPTVDPGCVLVVATV